LLTLFNVIIVFKSSCVYHVLSNTQSGVTTSSMLLKGDYKLVVNAEVFELFHLKLNPEERVDGECEEEAACASIFNSEK
jgi:hypothetical protein